MKLFLLILGAAVVLALPLLFLSGCAGTGEGGRWTPEDTRAAMGAVDQGLNTFQRAQAIYNGQAYPVDP